MAMDIKVFIYLFEWKHIAKNIGRGDNVVYQYTDGKGRDAMINRVQI